MDFDDICAVYRERNALSNCENISAVSLGGPRFVVKLDQNLEIVLNFGRRVCAYTWTV